MEKVYHVHMDDGVPLFLYLLFVVLPNGRPGIFRRSLTNFQVPCVSSSLSRRRNEMAFEYQIFSGRHSIPSIISVENAAAAVTSHTSSLVFFHLLIGATEWALDWNDPGQQQHLFLSPLYIQCDKFSPLGIQHPAGPVNETSPSFLHKINYFFNRKNGKKNKFSLPHRVE